MAKSKRIFMISDFKNESAKSIRMQPRMWLKGFLRLGHDVQQFSYRNIMIQCSPFPSKRIARNFAINKADSLLIEQLRHYYPDIVLVMNMKYLNAQSVIKMRKAVPNAIFVGRDEDPFPEKNPARIAIAKQTDIVTTTSCGKFLQTYKDAGIACCAFIPNMCDPDLQHRYDVEKKWKADIIFTGKSEHKKLGQDNERYSLVKRISELPNSKIYGAFGIPRVEGVDYFYAISGAKIGMSLNSATDVRLCHSDRFLNYISCGTLTLAKKFPGANLLFEDQIHLRYFDTVNEFLELADWYLKHDQEREKIAKAGMERAHTEFNCQKIAQYMLDLVETGTYEAAWREIL